MRLRKMPTRSDDKTSNIFRVTHTHTHNIIVTRDKKTVPRPFKISACKQNCPLGQKNCPTPTFVDEGFVSTWYFITPLAT